MNTSLMLGIMDQIGGFFGTLIYGLFNIIFLIMDWLQGLFRSLVGLNGSVVKGVEIEEGDNASYDLIFQLIQTDIVQDVFWSMVICGLILLGVLTFLAIIRNLYQEKPKPVSEFISRVFKALSMYVFVPVTVVLGLAASNILLILIDGATSQGKTSMMSNNLFIASAYNANVFRAANDNNERIKKFNEMIADTDVEELAEFKVYADKDPDDFTPEDWDKLADIIDQGVAQGLITIGNDKITKYDGWQLDNFYEMFKINYLILLVGGVSMIGILFKICWGLIGRIFNLIFEFIMMPVVISIWPMDEGKAFNSWKGEFIKNLTMAYTAIGVLNIYYSILPVVDKLEFSSSTMPAGLGWTAGLFNFILKVILQIVGIGAASGLISMANGWFSSLGIGDVQKAGADTKGQLKSTWDATTKPIKGGVQKVGRFAGSVKGGWNDARENDRNRFWGAVKGAYAGTGIPDKLDKGSGLEAYRSGRDSGEKYAGEHISKEQKRKQEANKVRKVAEARNILAAGDNVASVDDDKLSRYGKYLENSDLGQSILGTSTFGSIDQEISDQKTIIDKSEKSKQSLETLLNNEGAFKELENYGIDLSVPAHREAIQKYLEGDNSRLMSILATFSPENKTGVLSSIKDLESSFEGMKDKEALFKSLKTAIKGGSTVTLKTSRGTRSFSPTDDLRDLKTEIDSTDIKEFYEYGALEVTKLTESKQKIVNDISEAKAKQKKYEDAREMELIAFSELMKIGNENSAEFRSALTAWVGKINKAADSTFTDETKLKKAFEDMLKDRDKKAKSKK